MIYACTKNPSLIYEYLKPIVDECRDEECQDKCLYLIREGIDVKRLLPFNIPVGIFKFERGSTACISLMPCDVYEGFGFFKPDTWIEYVKTLDIDDITKIFNMLSNFDIVIIGPNLIEKSILDEKDRGAIRAVHLKANQEDFMFKLRDFEGYGIVERVILQHLRDDVLYRIEVPGSRVNSFEEYCQRVLGGRLKSFKVGIACIREL